MNKIIIFWYILLSLSIISTYDFTQNTWPISKSSTPDLIQTKPFGPTLLASSNYKYNWHKGLDIPCPQGTPLYAIADGVIKIAGTHSEYSNPLIQVEHNFGGVLYYANYIYAQNVVVSIGQTVIKGQQLSVCGASDSGYNLVHFEISKAGLFQQTHINPWRVLPRVNTPNEPLSIKPKSISDLSSGNKNYTFYVTQPGDKLILNGLKIQFLDSQNQTLSTYETNFEEINYYSPSNSALDNPVQGNWEFSPFYFGSFYHERARYNITLFDISGTSNAKFIKIDVLTVEDTPETQIISIEDFNKPSYDFNNNIWPISRSAQPDLIQTSPFGPRLKVSEHYRYDWHRGVDIPCTLGDPIYAIADGLVVKAGIHATYSDPLVQIRHDFGGVTYYSNYLHAQDVIVTVGDTVKKGQQICGCGASVSGFAHLHFEIRKDRFYQKNCINPWTVLPHQNTPNEAMSITLQSLVELPNGNYNYTFVVTQPGNKLLFNGLKLDFQDVKNNTIATHTSNFDDMTYNIPNTIDLDNRVQGNWEFRPRYFGSNYQDRVRYNITLFDINGTQLTVQVKADILNTDKVPQITYLSFPTQQKQKELDDVQDILVSSIQDSYSQTDILQLYTNFIFTLIFTILIYT